MWFGWFSSAAASAVVGDAPLTARDLLRLCGSKAVCLIDGGDLLRSLLAEALGRSGFSVLVSDAPLAAGALDAFHAARNFPTTLAVCGGIPDASPEYPSFVADMALVPAGAFEDGLVSSVRAAADRSEFATALFVIVAVSVIAAAPLVAWLDKNFGPKEEKEEPRTRTRRGVSLARKR